MAPFCPPLASVSISTTESCSNCDSSPIRNCRTSESMFFAAFRADTYRFHACLTASVSKCSGHVVSKIGAASRHRPRPHSAESSFQPLQCTLTTHEPLLPCRFPNQQTLQFFLLRCEISLFSQPHTLPRVPPQEGRQIRSRFCCIRSDSIPNSFTSNAVTFCCSSSGARLPTGEHPRQPLSPC